MVLTGLSIAPAEIALTFAHMFRNYDLSLPKEKSAPKALDRFTLSYERPGLPVAFRPRE